jgi:gamma-glutamyl-gamma-aminobutyrate hydrolase PuuD
VRHDPIAEPPRGSYIAVMSLPVIGITVDSEQSGGYSKFPWYALRENYSTAVTRAGGLPYLRLPSNCGAKECFHKRWRH